MKTEKFTYDAERKRDCPYSRHIDLNMSNTICKIGDYTCCRICNHNNVTHIKEHYVLCMYRYSNRSNKFKVRLPY